MESGESGDEREESVSPMRGAGGLPVSAGNRVNRQADADVEFQDSEGRKMLAKDMIGKKVTKSFGRLGVFTGSVESFRVETAKKRVHPVIFIVYFSGDDSRVEFNSKDLLRYLD